MIWKVKNHVSHSESDYKNLQILLWISFFIQPKKWINDMLSLVLLKSTSKFNAYYSFDIDVCMLWFTYINKLPNMNSRLEIWPQGPSKKWMTQKLQNHKHVPWMYVGAALCIPYIACHEVTGNTKPFCVTDIHCCVTCNHSIYMCTFSSVPRSCIWK